MKVLSILLLLLLVSCAQEEGNIPSEKIIAVDHKPKSITDGEHIETHPDGSVKTKGAFKNGKRTGVWTSYFTNGKIQSENKYKKGVLNGKTAAYYPNGNAQYVGLYIGNKKDDSWFFYLEDGTLDQEILYKDGQKIKTTP